MLNRGNSPQGQFQISADILYGMLEAGGLKPKMTPADQTTTWAKYKNTGYQGYAGMFQNTMQAYNDDLNLVSKYTPSGRNRYSDSPTPGITDRVIKMQQELDLNRRGELVKGIVKDLAPLMPDLPQDYDQKPYVLHWPWIRNYNTFATLGFDSKRTRRLALRPITGMTLPRSQSDIKRSLRLVLSSGGEDRC